MQICRLSSGNQYTDKTRIGTDDRAIANIAAIIQNRECRAPSIKTLKTFLAEQDEDLYNQLMVNFVRKLDRDKFFEQHSELFLKNKTFLLGADCVHTATYDCPHSVNLEKENNCPFCLKRVYNKNTDKEKVRYMHCSLVFCLVFPRQNLKIPIYTRPIYAQQVQKIQSIETLSDVEHKQECELVAFQEVLPKLIKMAPFLKKSFILLDGLYATRNVIRLLQSLNLGFAIVRKSERFKCVSEEFNSLSQLEEHQKNFFLKTIIEKEYVKLERQYEMLNSIDISDSNSEKLHVNFLKFSEYDRKRESLNYQGEWLCSEYLSKSNCALVAEISRARWQEEDLFNTLKNRGYKLKHKYSKHPKVQLGFQGFTFFAFGIFELFRLSSAVLKRYSKHSAQSLAEKLKAQIQERAPEEVLSPDLLNSKIQFRYKFSAKTFSEKCCGQGCNKKRAA